MSRTDAILEANQLNRKRLHEECCPSGSTSRACQLVFLLPAFSFLPQLGFRCLLSYKLIFKDRLAFHHPGHAESKECRGFKAEHGPQVADEIVPMQDLE